METERRPQRQKPGRKPLETAAENKRQEQMRAAQRSHRERQKQYLQDLESSNAQLKEEVARLKASLTMMNPDVEQQPSPSHSPQSATSLVPSPTAETSALPCIDCKLAKVKMTELSHHIKSLQDIIINLLLKQNSGAPHNINNNGLAITASNQLYASPITVNSYSYANNINALQSLNEVQYMTASLPSQLQWGGTADSGGLNFNDLDWFGLFGGGLAVAAGGPSSLILKSAVELHGPVDVDAFREKILSQATATDLSDILHLQSKLMKDYLTSLKPNPLFTQNANANGFDPIHLQPDTFKFSQVLRSLPSLNNFMLEIDEFCLFLEGFTDCQDSTVQQDKLGDISMRDFQLKSRLVSWHEIEKYNYEFEKYKNGRPFFSVITNIFDLYI
ncbi:hypothetical protein HK100_005611 [Physocladia obscura]|uniref:BZIP domain-containing protein n=1 Tax=Physocladia obscura TaxID=109957 RepID=A0AAD5SRE2_9FUNG|nr:hypothetical protein HK100_005611 [Physocladia obscura]